MGKIDGNQVFDDSLIKAPLELNKNMLVLLGTVERLIKGLKATEATMAKSTGAKKVDQANQKRKKTLTELNKVELQIQKTQEKSTQKYIEQKAALDRANKANRERTKTLNENIALENKQLGTLEKLALANKKLVTERNKLNLATAKGQKRLKDINTQLDKNNKTIKNNNDALGKQKINVGNYKDAISGLPGPLGAAARATNGMTKSALAFIATPIGAVIAAIGLALGVLTAFFKGSEEGQNSFTKITKAALVVWGNFKDIIINVGKGLFKLVNFDLKGAKDAFGEAADGVKNFVKESKAEIAVQNELSDLRAKNIKLQRELFVQEATIRRDVAILREEAAKTEETDAANSAKLIRQAITLQDQLASKREEVARNNLTLLREEAALSESTTETLNEIAQAEAALINVQTERANLVKRLTKELNTLDKKAITQAKNQVTLAKQTFSELKAIAPTQDEQLDLIAPNTDALQERLDANLEVYKENQKKLNEIDAERKAVRDELIAESIEVSKQIFSDFTALRIQQIGQELEAVEFARNRELEVEGLSARQKDAINEKFNKKKMDLERKQLNAQKASSLFQIAINTAVGISKTIATLGFPAATPFIVLAAIAGASQAAVVLAQKPPQFDAGSESTPADYIAGEKRPELRKSKGKWSLVDRPTLFGNSPGDKIIGGSETNEILGTMADLAAPSLLSPGNVLSGLESRKERKQSELIGEIQESNKILREIKRRPSAHISVSRQRTEVREKHGNNWVNRLDARYKGRV